MLLQNHAREGVYKSSMIKMLRISQCHVYLSILCTYMPIFHGDDIFVIITFYKHGGVLKIKHS